MENFRLSTESNLRDLPIKQRIKAIQEQSRLYDVEPLTWKQAKKTLAYVTAGKTYINDTYQVQHCVGNEVHDLFDPKLKGDLDYLSIKRHDKKPCRNWTEFQQIKNMICKNGENRFAVEIYPPEKFLVNSANQYHLWVFDEKVDLGFGFRYRNVNLKHGYQTVKVNGVEFTTGQGDIDE